MVMVTKLSKEHCQRIRICSPLATNQMSVFRPQEITKNLPQPTGNLDLQFDQVLIVVTKKQNRSLLAYEKTALSKWPRLVWSFRRCWPKTSIFNEWSAHYGRIMPVFKVDMHLNEGIKAIYLSPYPEQCDSDVTSHKIFICLCFTFMIKLTLETLIMAIVSDEQIWCKVTKTVIKANTVLSYD